MVGNWLAGFRRSSKERMVGEQKGQAEGSGPGVERRGLVGTDPRNHQVAFKVKSLAVVPEDKG